MINQKTSNSYVGTEVKSTNIYNIQIIVLVLWLFISQTIGFLFNTLHIGTPGDYNIYTSYILLKFAIQFILNVTLLIVSITAIKKSKNIKPKNKISYFLIYLGVLLSIGGLLFQLPTIHLLLNY
ncbi:MAG TPA: hypothetical protein VJ103_01610 [Candidatus Paceibacterota bacterium]|nr:hypothetical protein [Candidatus Paceibacterota bacterium]